MRTCSVIILQLRGRSMRYLVRNTLESHCYLFLFVASILYPDTRETDAVGRGSSSTSALICVNLRPNKKDYERVLDSNGRAKRYAWRNALFECPCTSCRRTPRPARLCCVIRKICHANLSLLLC